MTAPAPAPGRALPAILALALLLPGCATTARGLAPALHTDEAGATSAHDGLQFEVVPAPANLRLPRGVVAIEVRITNLTPHDVQVRRADFELLLDNGASRNALSPFQVARMALASPGEPLAPLAAAQSLPDVQLDTDFLSVSRGYVTPRTSTVHSAPSVRPPTTPATPHPVRATYRPRSAVHVHMGFPYYLPGWGVSVGPGFHGASVAWGTSWRVGATWQPGGHSTWSPYTRSTWCPTTRVWAHPRTSTHGHPDPRRTAPPAAAPAAADLSSVAYAGHALHDMSIPANHHAAGLLYFADVRSGDGASLHWQPRSWLNRDGLDRRTVRLHSR
ncbi:MAG: hypothetical protein EA398_01550 [Deltaproteobacteria bacterium]|nr:MAG: hypothetical protein EA398_01550 [Deltaproteobacteria bacterium]